MILIKQLMIIEASMKKKLSMLPDRFANSSGCSGAAW